MTAVQLLNSLEKQGATLWEDEGRLRYRAPKGVMNEDLLSEITDKKHEIISVLQNRKKDFASTLPQIIPDPQQLHQPFPLTDIQHAYWIGRSGALQLGNIACHAYFEIDTENLDLDRYTQAWQRVIERHDMLRAIILPDGQQQILEHSPPYQIDVLDPRGESPDEVESQLEAVRQRMCHQISRTDQWPLFEVRASRIDDRCLRLHIDIDMLVADINSIGIIMRELAQLYQNPDIILVPLELSFRDYVLAEVSFRESNLYQESREYWINRLPTLPPGPELPLAKNPGDLAKPLFVRRAHKLDAEPWLRLKTRASQAGLTPSGILLAAYAEILSVWSKSPRFTINLTLFNRLPVHPQVNDIVGDFTSAILLEVDNSAQEPFETRALRIQRQLWKDMDHRYFGGVRGQRELTRLRGEPQKAVIPIVFTSALGLGSLEQDATTSNEFGFGISQTPQVWLDHQIFEQDGILEYNWDAVEELFPDGLLDDMFDAYCRLLQKLADEEETWQETAYGLLPAAQLEKRAAVNATEAPISSEMLHTLFAAQVLDRAEQPAVVSSSHTLSYEELSKRSNKLGRLLREKGAQPNTLVAVVMEKGWEQVVAVLGILQSGAAYLPIDPKLPKERLWHLLENGKVHLVLTQSWLDEKLKWPEGIQRFSVDTMDLTDKDTHLPDPVQEQEDLAYVIYTSGSTGLPKGVMIDHRGAVNTILDVNKRFGVGPEDKVLALSNLNFDLSVYDIFGTLAAGGAIVLPEAAGTKDPAHWSELMRRGKVTVWNSVPALMQMLVEYASGRTEVLPQSLRLVLLSGDWIPLGLPDQIKALVEGVQVISLGGATEASIWSNLYPIEEVDPEWKSIPYGRPMVNQRFYVLNEFMEDCPDWVPGQLYIGGAGLAKGYWRDEEKTKDSFIVHPRTGEWLYRTGDLGRYLPDGNIEFFGREDFQIKIRGYRIELGEIEATLKQHPGVHDSVVKALGDPRGDKRLVAYVIPDQDKVSLLFETRSEDRAEIRTRWDPLVEAGYQQAQQDTVNLQNLTDFWHSSERLYDVAVRIMLNELRIFNQPQEKHSVDDIMYQCQISPRYRKWLNRALLALVEKGVLQRHGEVFESLLPLPTESLDTLLEEIISKIPKVDSLMGRKQIDLMIFGAKNLADLLRERVHSAQIYTSEGALAVYQKLFKYCNSIVRELLRSMVQSFRDQRHLRILEVGSGHGGCTREVLPVLLPEQTTYFFTDISKYFLQNAEKNFEAYPFVKYELLDLEKSPQVQGYELHSFDIVIASSVLHDTRSIKETLQHIRSLLAPGGLLLMTEETQFHSPFELGMGLQQGFDRFEDVELRSNNHPLLSRNQWKEQLEAREFEDFVVFNKVGSVYDFLGFDVIVARGPSSIKLFKPMELNKFLRETLPDYMVPSSYMLLDAFPLTPNSKVDREVLPIPDHVRSEPERAVVAPRTPTEIALANIWTEVINIERVGIHDNFFELGGDSLLATQVMTRIRKTLGLEISVQNLYEAPTISVLADMIKKIENGSWSPLVPMQPQGSDTPFFCLHEAAGSLFGYRNLVPLLGPEIPVYGFKPRGLDGQQELHTEIEAMASEYIKALRVHQPEGPYRLMGFCMGGYVAYEMARQLEADGQIVDPLVLIDTIPFAQEFYEGEMSWLGTFLMYLSIPLEKFGLEGLFSGQARVMGFDKPLAEGTSPVATYSIIHQKSSDERFKFVFDVAHSDHHLPPETDFDQFNAMFTMMRTNMKAMARYHPRPFRESIIFFRAEEPKGRPDYSEFWKNMVPQQGFRLYDICGDHFSMMEEQNVRIMVKKLKDLLNEKS